MPVRAHTVYSKQDVGPEGAVFEVEGGKRHEVVSMRAFTTLKPGPFASFDVRRTSPDDEACEHYLFEGYGLTPDFVTHKAISELLDNDDSGPGEFWRTEVVRGDEVLARIEPDPAAPGGVRKFLVNGAPWVSRYDAPAEAEAPEKPVSRDTGSPPPQDVIDAGLIGNVIRDDAQLFVDARESVAILEAETPSVMGSFWHELATEQLASARRRLARAVLSFVYNGGRIPAEWQAAGLVTSSSPNFFIMVEPFHQSGAEILYDVDQADVRVINMDLVETIGVDQPG